MIASDLSWSTHCNMVVSREYKQLGLVLSLQRRNFVFPWCVHNLYTALRSGDPTYIQLLEKVQWRATKFILNDYLSSYKVRLTK